MKRGELPEFPNAYPVVEPDPIWDSARRRASELIATRVVSRLMSGADVQRVLVVGGPPGVGKTRLIRDALSRPEIRSRIRVRLAANERFAEVGADSDRRHVHIFTTASVNEAASLRILLSGRDGDRGGAVLVETPTADFRYADVLLRPLSCIEVRARFRRRYEELGLVAAAGFPGVLAALAAGWCDAFEDRLLDLTVGALDDVKVQDARILALAVAHCLIGIAWFDPKARAVVDDEIRPPLHSETRRGIIAEGVTQLSRRGVLDVAPAGVVRVVAPPILGAAAQRRLVRMRRG